MAFGKKNKPANPVTPEEVADLGFKHEVAAAKDKNSSVYDHFHSQEEAGAYVQGVEDAMYVTDHEDDYRFVDEEKYNKLRDIWNNGEV